MSFIGMDLENARRDLRDASEALEEQEQELANLRQQLTEQQAEIERLRKALDAYNWTLESAVNGTTDLQKENAEQQRLLTEAREVIAVLIKGHPMTQSQHEEAATAADKARALLSRLQDTQG